jgi:hypothetical protein
VTGGGFDNAVNRDSKGIGLQPQVLESKKYDNGWVVSLASGESGYIVEVYAECLKVVNEGTAG